MWTKTNIFCIWSCFIFFSNTGFVMIVWCDCIYFGTVDDDDDDDCASPVLETLAASAVFVSSASISFSFSSKFKMLLNWSLVTLTFSCSIKSNTFEFFNIKKLILKICALFMCHLLLAHRSNHRFYRPCPNQESSGPRSTSLPWLELKHLSVS